MFSEKSRKILGSTDFATGNFERVSRRRYRTRNEARADIFDDIEQFCNGRRRHSTLGSISPMEFENELN